MFCRRTTTLGPGQPVHVPGAFVPGSALQPHVQLRKCRQPTLAHLVRLTLGLQVLDTTHGTRIAVAYIVVYVVTFICVAPALASYKCEGIARWVQSRQVGARTCFAKLLTSALFLRLTEQHLLPSVARWPVRLRPHLSALAVCATYYLPAPLRVAYRGLFDM